MPAVSLSGVAGCVPAVFVAIAGAVLISLLVVVADRQVERLGQGLTAALATNAARRTEAFLDVTALNMGEYQNATLMVGDEFRWPSSDNASLEYFMDAALRSYVKQRLKARHVALSFSFMDETILNIVSVPDVESGVLTAVSTRSPPYIGQPGTIFNASDFDRPRRLHRAGRYYNMTPWGPVRLPPDHWFPQSIPFGITDLDDAAFRNASMHVEGGLWQSIAPAFRLYPKGVRLGMLPVRVDDYVFTSMLYAFPLRLPAPNDVEPIGIAGALEPLGDIALFLQRTRSTPNTIALLLDRRGYVVSSADIKEGVLDPQPQTSPLPAGCAAVLDSQTLLGDGRMVCRPRFASLEPRLSGIDFNADAALLRPGSSNSFVRGSGRDRIFVGIESLLFPVPGDNVFLLVAVPYAEVLGSLTKVQNLTIGLLIPATVICAVIVFFAVKVLLRPVARVAEQMKASIYLDEDDAANRASGRLGRVSEVAELQFAFEAMVAELRRLRSFIPEAARVRPHVSIADDETVYRADSLSSSAGTFTPRNATSPLSDKSSPGNDGAGGALTSPTEGRHVLWSRRVRLRPASPLPEDHASSSSSVSSAAWTNSSRNNVCSLRWHRGVQRRIVTVLAMKVEFDLDPRAISSGQPHATTDSMPRSPLLTIEDHHHKRQHRRSPPPGHSPPGLANISSAAVNRPKTQEQLYLHVFATIVDVISAAVHKSGGIVLSHAGPDVIAVFNAAQRCAAHEEKALRLASKIEGAVRSAGVSAGCRRCTVRCGVASSTCVIGNTGSSAARSFAVIGVAVTQAVLLRDLTPVYGPGCRLLAAKRCVLDADDAVEFAFVDVVALPASEGGVRPTPIAVIVVEGDQPYQRAALEPPHPPSRPPSAALAVPGWVTLQAEYASAGAVDPIPSPRHGDGSAEDFRNSSASSVQHVRSRDRPSPRCPRSPAATDTSAQPDELSPRPEFSPRKGDGGENGLFDTLNEFVSAAAKAATSSNASAGKLSLRYDARSLRCSLRASRGELAQRGITDRIDRILLHLQNETPRATDDADPAPLPASLAEPPQDPSSGDLLTLVPWHIPVNNNTSSMQPRSTRRDREVSRPLGSELGVFFDVVYGGSAIPDFADPLRLSQRDGVDAANRDDSSAAAAMHHMAVVFGDAQTSVAVLSACETAKRRACGA